jgi:tRNA(fMet)-specific endonuclease VapC
MRKRVAIALASRMSRSCSPSLLLVEVRRQDRPWGAHDLVAAATAKASRRTAVTADAGAGAFESLPGVTLRSHRR